MAFPEFTDVEIAIIDEIRPKERENHYVVTVDGLTVVERWEHAGPNGNLSPDIISRLDGGERLRLIRNDALNSGLSLRDILWLGRFPGVLEVVVVTPSGSLYRATTHEWHAQDNRIARLERTLMNLSPELSLMIRRGTVEDNELRTLADRMPRHFLAQRLYEIGALDYHVEQSLEDTSIVVELGKTRLKGMWLKVLQDQIRG